MNGLPLELRNALQRDDWQVLPPVVPIDHQPELNAGLPRAPSLAARPIVQYKYFYDGGQLVQRETYRNLLKAGRLMPEDLRPEVTRIVPTLPSGGPVLYADSDGVVDVDFRDRYGQPWLLYRAREGRHWKVDRLLDSHFPDSWSEKVRACRHTGLLKPLPPTDWAFIGVPQWHERVLEPDLLMGRRGIAGWDGNDYDAGLLIHGPSELARPATDADEGPPGYVRWVASWSDGEVVLYSGLAAVAIVGIAYAAVAAVTSAAAAKAGAAIAAAASKITGGYLAVRALHSGLETAAEYGIVSAMGQDYGNRDSHLLSLRR